MSSRKPCTISKIFSWTTVLLILQSMAALTPAYPQAQFMGLGNLPAGLFDSGANGVSADGTTVVGWAKNQSGATSGVRWINGVVSPPGSTIGQSANAASADGRSVVGMYLYGGTSHGYYYNSNSWYELLDTASLNGISGGAQTAVGVHRRNDGVFGAIRLTYTAPSTFVKQDLGSLLSLGYSRGRGISLDGNTLVGDAAGPGGTQAFRWTQSGGMENLDPLNTSFSSIAYAASAAGEVIVGERTIAAGTEGFFWNQFGGMTGIGDLPGGDFASHARAIDGLGMTIVGYGNTADGDRAFIWNPVNGMRELSTVLSALGANLAGWTLTQATGVSLDGSVIVGNGINPSGFPQAWRAVIPEPATAMLGVLALVLIRRRR